LSAPRTRTTAHRTHTHLGVDFVFAFVVVIVVVIRHGGGGGAAAERIGLLAGHVAHQQVGHPLVE
jgi:hypothetical protein